MIDILTNCIYIFFNKTKQVFFSMHERKFCLKFIIFYISQKVYSNFYVNIKRICEKNYTNIIQFPVNLHGKKIFLIREYFIVDILK